MIWLVWATVSAAAAVGNDGAVHQNDAGRRSTDGDRVVGTVAADK